MVMISSRGVVSLRFKEGEYASPEEIDRAIEYQERLIERLDSMDAMGQVVNAVNDMMIYGIGAVRIPGNVHKDARKP